MLFSHTPAVKNMMFSPVSYS